MVAKKYQSKTGGLNEAGRKFFKRTTGANLKRPVTGKAPKGSKAAGRRASFCARMGGVKGPMKDSKGRPTRKALALKAWGFGSVESASKFCQTHKKS